MPEQAVIPDDPGFDADAEARRRQREESATVKNFIPGIPAFELLGASQLFTIREYVKERLDLGDDQFIVNRFGLPFMPVPQPRWVNNDSKYRAIPDGVNGLAATHPIFWVTEDVLGEVPEDVESDAAQEWSIRMFCFLLMCGLIDESYEVKDYLAISGVPLVHREGEKEWLDAEIQQDLESYRSGMSIPTVFDPKGDKAGVSYLGFDSIVVKSGQHRSVRERYEAYCEKLIAHCSRVQEEQIAQTVESIQERITRSEDYLLDRESGDIVVHSESDHRSWWSRNYGSDYTGFLEEYRDVLTKNLSEHSFMTRLDTFSQEVERDAQEMSMLAAALLGPILVYRESLSESDVISLQAFQRLANERAARENNRYELTLRDVSVTGNVPPMMSADNADERERWRERSIAKLDSFLSERRARLEDAYRRLVLCYANYERTTNHEEIFESFEEAAWQLEAEQRKKGPTP